MCTPASLDRPKLLVDRRIGALYETIRLVCLSFIQALFIKVSEVKLCTF
jgi:hypothetical protein